MSDKRYCPLCGKGYGCTLDWEWERWRELCAPVVITDEMVERSTLAMTNELRRKVGLSPMASLDELEPDERRGFTSDIRIALEAAFREQTGGRKDETTREH